MSHSIKLTCAATDCEHFQRCTLAAERLVGKQPKADFYPDKMLIPVLSMDGAFGVECGEYVEREEETRDADQN